MLPIDVYMHAGDANYNFHGQIADVADEEVHKLEKKFKGGSEVRARILGFRLLEGLAMGVLKVYFYNLFHAIL